MAGRLLVYGAYGYTGELVARRAAGRGLSPILAGRDSERLVRLARELGLEWRAFPLTDAATVRRGISGAGAVLLCAGPFVHTFRPVAEACIAERVHYLDVAGEIPVLEALVAMGPSAAAAGVMLLPAAGFDVVPSDCLAAHLVRRLPSARSVTLATVGFDRLSRGTARTMLEQAASARATARIPQRRIDLGAGPLTFIAMPWPETFVVPRSTGVAEVTTYMAQGPAQRAVLRAVPHLAPLFEVRVVRDLVAALMTGGERGPNPEDRARRGTVLYGEASDAAGGRVAALQRQPDGYELTALAAVEIAARVLRGEVKPGWQSPSTAYGPDLVLALPGVSREDVAPR